MTAPSSVSKPPGYDRRRYVHVAQSDQVTDLRTDLTMSPAALVRRLDGIQPEDWSAQAWLFAGPQAIQKVDAYGFFPNQPQIVEQDGARYLNRWKARDFQPAEGDVTPFLEHLAYLYDGDGETVQFVLDWMACLVQKPEQKQSSAILLTSEAEGIGKGLKGKMLSVLVGEGNTRYLSSDALSSDFNDWLATTSLVIVEEFEDNGRRSAMARIKNYITDEVVDINPKHAARYRARNQANFLFFANAAAPVKLAETDRRFLVHRSQAQPKSDAYYRELMDWFMGEGRCHVLHFLLNRDLSHYNPRGRAPGRGPTRNWWCRHVIRRSTTSHRAFEAQEPPFACDLVVVKHVVDHVNSIGRVRLNDTQRRGLFTRHRCAALAASVPLDRRSRRTQSYLGHSCARPVARRRVGRAGAGRLRPS